MKAKLARLQAQEQAFLARLKGSKDEGTSQPQTNSQPSQKNKRKRKHKEEEEPATTEKNLGEELLEHTDKSFRKSRKKKRQKDERKGMAVGSGEEEAAGVSGPEELSTEQSDQSSRKRKKKKRQHHEERKMGVCDEGGRDVTGGPKAVNSEADTDPWRSSKKWQQCGEDLDTQDEEGKDVLTEERKVRRKDKKKRQQCCKEMVLDICNKDDDGRTWEVENEGERSQPHPKERAGISTNQRAKKKKWKEGLKA